MAALAVVESDESNLENDLIQSSFHAESKASTSALCLENGGALWISWLASGAPDANSSHCQDARASVSVQAHRRIRCSD